MKEKQAEVISHLPDLDFRPCRICGRFPEYGVQMHNEEDYTVSLKCCEFSGDTLSKKEDEWIKEWDRKNELDYERHLHFMSDDWEDKCCVCGCKWMGYGDLDSVYFNGKQYCKRCSTKFFNAYFKNGEYHVGGDVYGLASLYPIESPPSYATTLEEVMKFWSDCKNFRAAYLDKNSAPKLDFHGYSGRWQIFGDSFDLHGFVACVFQPSSIELEKLKKIELPIDEVDPWYI